MKNTTALFFIFIIVQGILYSLLIPPWQSPDEPHHFGKGVLFSKNAALGSENHRILSKEIVRSMATFHAWQYQNLPRPEPLPQSLTKLPFYHGIESLSEREPLYYLINSFILKVFNLKKSINQFYLIRFLSFFYYVFTVYFIYLSSKLIFKGNIPYIFATVCFVGFLPQFLIISTSVNPINLSVLLGAAFLYTILYSLFKGKNLIALFLSPLIIGLAFFNHRVALFMIPPFVVLLSIYFVRSLKNRKELIKISIIILAVLLIFILLFFTAQHFFPDYFKKVVNFSGVKPRIDDINKFTKYVSIGTSQSISNFLNGFFKTFWFFAGWLRFEYHLDIYSVLKLICLLSVLGLLKYLYSYLARKEYTIDVDFASFLILAAAGLPIILGIIIRYYPRSIMVEGNAVFPYLFTEVAQGRYLFPAIGALAIFFVLGLKEIAPKRLKRWVPLFIIVGFMAMNIYTVFHSLIRFFYFFTNA